MTPSLANELELLAQALDNDASQAAEFSVAHLAERIGRYLGVKTSEVAILGLSNRWRHLHFLVPEALKNVGYIPLSSTSALAARTARESRPEIVNNFAAIRHASVFESVKTNPEGSDVIQKIISAPVLVGDKVVGVIQISRKSETLAGSGPDFTHDDLGRVLALCGPLGKLIQRLNPE